MMFFSSDINASSHLLISKAVLFSVNHLTVCGQPHYLRPCPITTPISSQYTTIYPSPPLPQRHSSSRPNFYHKSSRQLRFRPNSPALRCFWDINSLRSLNDYFVELRSIGSNRASKGRLGQSLVLESPDSIYENLNEEDGEALECIYQHLDAMYASAAEKHATKILTLSDGIGNMYKVASNGIKMSKYNNKYVQYVKEDVEVHGLLRCSGENLVTPYTKYKIERVKIKIGGGLVHIRCCYNNKYLVKRSPSQWWIIAGSDEPVEAMSSWSCTLFESVPLDSQTIRFRHVQLGHFACLWRTSDAFDFGLFAVSEAEDKDQRDVFTIIDWESLCILPWHERFWRYTGVGHDWIWPDSDDTTSVNCDTIFWPVKVDNVIALKSLGNNNVFCKRFTIDDVLIHLFSANSNDISREVRLEVQQLATSRNIYNVNYHLKDARIYNQSVDLLLASTKVEISADSIGVFEWEKMIERNNISEAAYKITMSPMTRVKVNLLTTEGSCDVPFSYDQCDTLMDGSVVTITMDDGIYTGVNYYNFKYETEEEKL
ncbi:hypothetical protein LguiA_022117 [Lonicera macranthoides]